MCYQYEVKRHKNWTRYRRQARYTKKGSRYLARSQRKYIAKSRSVEKTTKKIVVTAVWVVLNSISDFGLDFCTIAPPPPKKKNRHPFSSLAVADTSTLVRLYLNGNKVLYMTAKRRATIKCTPIPFFLIVLKDLDISTQARTGCSLHSEAKKRVKTDSVLVTKVTLPLNSLLMSTEVIHPTYSAFKSNSHFVTCTQPEFTTKAAYSKHCMCWIWKLLGKIANKI